MISLQSDQVNQLSSNVANASMVCSIAIISIQWRFQSIDLHKERMARRDIGMLTTNKSVPKQQKIIMPDAVDPPQRFISHSIIRLFFFFRYKRVPIDYSILDNVGHGTRSVDPTYGTTRGTVGYCIAHPSSY